MKQPASMPSVIVATASCHEERLGHHGIDDRRSREQSDGGEGEGEGRGGADINRMVITTVVGWLVMVNMSLGGAFYMVAGETATNLPIGVRARLRTNMNIAMPGEDCTVRKMSEIVL